jgi:hypothetical protein
VCRCSSSRRCGLAALVGRMETDEVFNFSQYEKHHRYILYNPDHTGNLPSSCSASSSANDVTCHMIQNSGCASRQSAAALPPLSSPLFSSLLSALCSLPFFLTASLALACSRPSALGSDKLCSPFLPLDPCSSLPLSRFFLSSRLLLPKCTREERNTAMSCIPLSRRQPARTPKCGFAVLYLTQLPRRNRSCSAATRVYRAAG